MQHSGLARLVAASGVAAATVFVAAAPALAVEEPPADARVYNEAYFTPRPPMGSLPKDAIKGCDGIPGGAKAGVDGWVFSVAGGGRFGDDGAWISWVFDPPGTARAYTISWAPDTVGEADEVLIGISEDGAGLFERSDLEGADTSTKAGMAKLLDVIKTAAANPDRALAGGLLGEDTAGGWLQTPIGGAVRFGMLLSEGGNDTASGFDVRRVCLPPADIDPAGTVPARTDTAGTAAAATAPVAAVE